MRIFPDEDGKMNLPVKDIGGEILLVLQLTLCANSDRLEDPIFYSCRTLEDREIIRRVRHGIGKERY